MTHTLLRDLVKDKDVLMAAIVDLAHRRGRYYFRRIIALLRREGWMVNVKWVERI